MKCRRMKRNENGINTVVWFGSYGKDGNNNSKFYNSNDIHDNFSENQDAVKDTLTQELSVIEGELWYAITTGLPLINKVTSKLELDAAITEIILNHSDVQEITDYSSQISNGHDYSADITIETIYGLLQISI